MTKNLDKIIKICKDYLKIQDEAPYSYGHNPGDILTACEKLKALGYKWGDDICFRDFSITKKPYITNSSTHYKFEDDKYYIVWNNGNVGRLQFVSQEYWWDVTDEWQEFRDRLMSYNPLDADPHNCNIIYDIENGKKVIEDYPEIVKQTREKMKQKTKRLQLEKAKKDYEKLLEEVGDEA